MFAYLAGMPLGEYVRKRRLSLAADMLRNGGMKVIDAALMCGYESPDAFGKAFHAVMGVTPSRCAKKDCALKAFPPLFFHLTLKGGIEMEYRVVEKGGFYIMGKVGHIPLIYNGPNPHTADVWKRLRQEDLLVLTEYAEAEPRGVVCAYGGGAETEGRVTAEGEEVLMCVGVVMEKPMPDRFKERFDVLPYEAVSWLVFAAMENARDGGNTVQQVWARVTEWLPTSEYEKTGVPNIVWYETYDNTKPDRRCELWVSVRKRM
jgi:AraC family transcriptional regulator